MARRLLVLILVSFCCLLPSCVRGFWWPGGGDNNPKCHVANHSFECRDADLTDFPTGIAGGVRTIDLKGNNITNLGNSLNFPQLISLDVSYNLITSLVNDVFEGCGELQILDLSNNLISHLQHGHFRGLQELTQLYLDGNQLQYLESDIFMPHLGLTLQVLDLSDNRLNELDHNALTDLKSLKSLHLRDNNIREIQPQHFAGLRKLEHVDLNQNIIQEIPADTWIECRNMDVLDLSLNKIWLVHKDAFRGLTNLNTLTLRGNLLDKIFNGTFTASPKLVNLHLDDNSFKEFDINAYPKSLQKFTASYNLQLQSIRNGTFTGLDKLHLVTISKCPSLTTIEAGAFSGPNTTIKRLDLSGNGLEQLPQSLINWEAAEMLDLGGNPWNCDCNAKWLKDVYDATNNRHLVRCAKPLQSSGKLVTELSGNDFQCLRYISYRQGAAIFLILFATFFFVVAGVGFAYRFRHKLFPGCNKDEYRYKAMYNTVDSEDSNAVPGADSATIVKNGAAPPPVAV